MPRHVVLSSMQTPIVVLNSQGSSDGLELFFHV
jgi:hypothetical protein